MWGRHRSKSSIYLCVIKQKPTSLKAFSLSVVIFASSLIGKLIFSFFLLHINCCFFRFVTGVGWRLIFHYKSLSQISYDTSTLPYVKDIIQVDSFFFFRFFIDWSNDNQFEEKKKLVRQNCYYDTINGNENKKLSYPIWILNWRWFWWFFDFFFRKKIYEFVEFCSW